MSITFNLDGTVTVSSDYTSEQETLKQQEYEWSRDQKVVLSTLESDLKTYRVQKLYETDWTQGEDSPLAVGIKSEWATYRQKLRDLPANAGAPRDIPKADWPLQPGESDIPPDALVYVSEVNDPLGIGTTSWIGVGIATTSVSGSYALDYSGIGTNMISVEGYGDTKAGDIFKSGSISATVSGVGTGIVDLLSTTASYEVDVGIATVAVEAIGDVGSGDYFISGTEEYEVLNTGVSTAGATTFDTVSLASTIATTIEANAPVKFRRMAYHVISLGSTISAGIGTGDWIQIDREVDEYYRQQKPWITPTVGFSTAAVTEGGSFDITVNVANILRSADYKYEIGYDPSSIVESTLQPSDFVDPTSGVFTVTSSGTTGVSTVSVSIASTINREAIGTMNPGRTFVLTVDVSPAGPFSSSVGFTTVGVTTT